MLDGPVHDAHSDRVGGSGNCGPDPDQEIKRRLAGKRIRDRGNHHFLSAHHLHCDRNHICDHGFELTLKSGPDGILMVDEKPSNSLGRIINEALPRM